MKSRRAMLIDTPIRDIDVRPARLEDYERVAALRTAYFERIGRPTTERPWDGIRWWVATVNGRVMAVASTGDLVDQPGVRYVYDFMRDETTVASVRAAISLARWLVSVARSDEATLVAAVDRRNPAFEEILQETGEWEPMATLYTLKGNS